MFTETLRSAAGRAYWMSPYKLAHLAGRVAILMYHRVLPRREAASTYVQPAMYVTPETFEANLRFLMDHFELLSFEALLAKWDAGDWDHRARYCTITFDDGWLDNYEHAYPLLRAYGAPATIFLPTDLVGTREWLWPDRLGELLRRRGGAEADWDSAIEQAKTLSDDDRARLIDGLAVETRNPPSDRRRLVNWDEAREMSRHGIAFGAHTRTHANLTRLTGSALESELRDPLDALERQRVNHVSVLAYPNGDHTDSVVQAARTAGYRAAVTVTQGVESRRPADLLRLKRIGIHDDVSRSAPLLALHLARQSRPGLS